MMRENFIKFKTSYLFIYLFIFDSNKIIAFAFVKMKILKHSENRKETCTF